MILLPIKEMALLSAEGGCTYYFNITNYSKVVFATVFSVPSPHYFIAVFLPGVSSNIYLRILNTVLLRPALYSFAR
jgi:hypothetical protein